MAESDGFWAEGASTPASAPREMSSAGKVVLGILTFWPALYMVLFMLFIVAAIATTAGRAGSQSGVPVALAALPILHIGTMLEMMALTVYYAVNVYNDPLLIGDRKILWMVIVILGGFLGQAIFYVMWIIKRSPAIASAPAPEPPTEPGSITTE